MLYLRRHSQHINKNKMNVQDCLGMDFFCVHGPIGLGQVVLKMWTVICLNRIHFYFFSWSFYSLVFLVSHSIWWNNNNNINDIWNNFWGGFFYCHFSFDQMINSTTCITYCAARNQFAEISKLCKRVQIKRHYYHNDNDKMVNIAMTDQLLPPPPAYCIIS